MTQEIEDLDPTYVNRSRCSDDSMLVLDRDLVSFLGMLRWSSSDRVIGNVQVKCCDRAVLIADIYS